MFRIIGRYLSRFRPGSIVLLASAVAVFGGLTTGAGTAHADTLGHIYALATTPANCMDNYGNFGGDGNPVGTYRCLYQDNQQWSYEHATHTIRLSPWAGSDKCLAVRPGASGGNGSPIVIETCGNGSWNTWIMVGSSLQNAESGRCLDDPNGQVHQLQLWDCNFGGNANQNWQIMGFDY